MCGIAGFIGDFQNEQELQARARVMAGRLHHRGPDDTGAWVDPQLGLGLAHARLSILDLSPEGHQPMASSCGRYLMVFNGEVYNHIELRRELEREGVRHWRGHSDTEVMLAAIASWGLPAALKRFVGMFAFALWDRETRRLSLARDRMGEKPLYYGRQGRLFLFGSELKALRAHPGFGAGVDRDALGQMLRFAYVPSPQSIYEGIRKLPAGCYLTLDPAADSDPAPVAYWSVREAAERGQADPFRGSEAEALDELERLLGEAVGLQMIADVPLGAFLSGGIDSSTIVALMQAQSARPVKTFSIGFWEQSFNEAEHAKAVAVHLGTEHTELYVTPQQALDVIPRLPELYDEPFADSSQVPTFLVSQLAREHVTVSLSGDAGDELFGGYNRYFWAVQIWRKLGRLPAPLRRLMAGAITSVSPAAWDRLFGTLQPILPGRLNQPNPGDKLHKLAGNLTIQAMQQVYPGLVTFWDDIPALVPGGRQGHSLVDRPEDWPGLESFQHQMMCLDALTYLPDDILVKVDRAAMGVSLETRVPLLDHRVVEFAWRLPLDMKIRGEERKYLLRQLLYRHVPRELIDRPKMGFGIPLGEWLRGPLRDWGEALIEPSRLRNEGWLDPDPVHALWNEHLSGQRNWSYHLWNVLVFQAWLEQQT
jgi:asparagine synthase (glutamine-hydrolysing)